MRLSIICASRLAVNPTSSEGNLWLDRALMSVQRNAVPGLEMEMVIAVDRGMGDKVPGRFSDVMIVESSGTGQAAAVNAGVRASTGHLIALIEDDDMWEPLKLGIQLGQMQFGYELVSSNQREIDEQGGFLRYNTFPTPSGWLMTRALWNAVGPFDESFRWHVDTEWLGRLNATKKRRVHLIHATGEDSPQLPFVRAHSDVLSTGLLEPLVQRLANDGGGMAEIRRGGDAAKQSALEHMRMGSQFGSLPW